MVATAWFRSLSRRERQVDEMNLDGDCALVAADPELARQLGVNVEAVAAEQARRQKAKDFNDWYADLIRGC